MEDEPWMRDWHPDAIYMKRDGYLSNFYLCPVEFDGIHYGSSENAYQAQKSLDPEVRKKFSVSGEWDSPRKAQLHGQEIELREDWDEVRNRVMFDVLLAKFIQNPELGKRLADLCGRWIEEANHHGDTYWGTVDGEGENMLGRLLGSLSIILRLMNGVREGTLLDHSLHLVLSETATMDLLLLDHGMITECEEESDLFGTPDGD